MSETPSLRAAKQRVLAVGQQAGRLRLVEGRRARGCTILPVSTDTRNRLRRLPLRAKKATVSPLGSKSMERPATKSSLIVMSSNLPV